MKRTTPDCIVALLVAVSLGVGLSAAQAQSVAPRTGHLYFVNLTGQAASLSLDGVSGDAMKHEVQARPTQSGSHTLRVDVAGSPPGELKVELAPKLVAQDRTGHVFWCVMAAIDRDDRLRLVPTGPRDCAKLVARGREPAPPGNAVPIQGDLYFMNIPQPVVLTVDGAEPVAVQAHKIFGRSIAAGEHALTVAVGPDQSVDLHVNFNAANIARDKAGAGYWCVVSATGPDGWPALFRPEPNDCEKLVASSAERRGSSKSP